MNWEQFIHRMGEAIIVGGSLVFVMVAVYLASSSIISAFALQTLAEMVLP